MELAKDKSRYRPTADDMAIRWAAWITGRIPTDEQLTIAKRRIAGRIIRDFLPATQLELEVCAVMRETDRRNGRAYTNDDESRQLVRDYWRKVYKTQYVAI